VTPCGVEGNLEFKSLYQEIENESINSNTHHYRIWQEAENNSAIRS